MFRKICVPLIATFIVLGITSCSSPSVETTPSLSKTLPPPTSTPTQPQPTAYPTMTPTTNYCFSYSSAILLPVSDTQGWSNDEIAGKLMELYLAYYHSPQTPDSCRIEGYSVDEVNCDEGLSDLTLEPKGDFVCKVQYSYQPVYQPSPVSVGYMDEQNWFHTWKFLAVFRSESSYTMEFARP